MTQQSTLSEPTQDDFLWAGLSYPIFFVMPIIALLMDEKKVRPFIKYHATQALIIQVILLIIMVLSSFTLIGLCCLPILWGITLWPAYEAYQGKMLEIPVLTDFARNQGWL
jgi:uncharacterized membrane protein